MPTVISPGRNNGIADRYGLEEIYYKEGLVVKVKKSRDVRWQHVTFLT